MRLIEKAIEKIRKNKIRKSIHIKAEMCRRARTSQMCESYCDHCAWGLNDEERALIEEERL